MVGVTVGGSRSGGGGGGGSDGDGDGDASEMQSKMIFMGHQISSCHVPVVMFFFILCEMLILSLNIPYYHLSKYTNFIYCYPKK